MKKFLLAILIVVLLATYQLRMWTVQSGPLVESVNVVIPKGESFRNMAFLLAQEGVINKPWLFLIAGRLSGLDKKLRAGEYQFSSQISMLEVLNKMASGDVFYRKVTLPEGLTTKQMLDIFNAEEVLNGEVSLSLKEGDLLPETYSFVWGDSKNNVVLQAQKGMQKALDMAWDNRDANLPLKNKAELLVLASIIEKETGVPEERGLVASVFVNRLRKGMRLQTDPTVIYALTKGQYELERGLSRKDLAIDDAFNTYVYAGLPPKPICNPGRASLEAAAHPESSEYIYFVARGNGGHNFAKSLNEHNKNVESYRKNN